MKIAHSHISKWLVLSLIIAIPICFLIYSFLSINPDPGGQNDEGFVPIPVFPTYFLAWLFSFLSLGAIDMAYQKWGKKEV